MGSKRSASPDDDDESSVCHIRIKDKKPHPSLGVIRLDYDYPPAQGDIDCCDSFSYPVFYKVVPGFTFSMCQSGKIPKKVRERFKSSIRWLAEEKRVSAITSDCGFMLQFQNFARKITEIPVFMSALSQLPGIISAYSPKENIIIMTANGKAFNRRNSKLACLIDEHCGIDTRERRFHFVGCEDVEGFEAVALGQKVDTAKVEPGVVGKALEAVHHYPRSRAIVLECTELPPYADGIRRATGLPVYDAFTACDFYISGFQDNPRFGLQNWQQRWDKSQEKYRFGMHLSGEERKELVNPEHRPVNRYEIVGEGGGGGRSGRGSKRKRRK